MRMTFKVFICLMTVSVSLLPVMGNKGGPDNFNCENTPENITALPGGSVTITCKYPRAKESHIKSFYKVDGNDQISSHSSLYTKLGRFSLTDDKQKGVYTVNISSLTKDDTGKYRCALKHVEDNSPTCLMEIHLHVWNWDDIKRVENISHVISETAQIKCHYPESHKGNEKFLCKGENPLNCEKIIQTTEEDRDVVRDRFDIRDNKRIKYFYMYINDLNEADSGTYWCGSGRTMQPDDYTKVHLSVGEYSNVLLQIEHILVRNSQQASVSNPLLFHPLTSVKGKKSKKSHPPHLQGKTTEPGPTTIKHEPRQKNGNILGVIIGVSVSLVLLVVAVVLLILYGCKLLRAQGEGRTFGDNEDHNYEEVHLESQVDCSPVTLYATVNLPEDLLQYSSVTFQKDKSSQSDTNINGTAPGATNPSAAE
ncbi:polymeric immunoglobulin receptor-like [Acanthochromis polyacanthus]|uniref:polymeric immunoglobulin receptor-like n=1 Tax=Acanthochromis polyacanthus TaxID=80966 RepID=UPI002234B8AE|nr:polymeric immunoglobulin receptor-like [Acanthochromis polyacanthus]